MLVGEARAGAGPNGAHVNTVLGRRDGPVGVSWATGLATPRAGHASFVVTARPGVAVQPPTLFVNKAAIADSTHANLTWGPAQAGVARGVGLALEEGVIARDEVHELVLIAAVWVNPAADDAGTVFENNTTATVQALRNAKAELPGVDEFLDAARAPFNSFFQPA
ncbi:MAG: formaldehyde-activating enzyme [Actinomycetota bacterium]|nr:formaldehyde-activating enzyme [Actinomycetota bacterium]